MIGRDGVARDVRRARGRARRERPSLGDLLSVLYVTGLFTTYPLASLAAVAAPHPGPVRTAASRAEPLLLLAVAIAVVVGRAAAAARGGPVSLPPEEGRILLTWPVPRRAVVLPALGAAVTRALVAGVAVSALFLYVDILDLGAPAAAVLRDDLVLPPLVSLVAVLLAWLVQSHPRSGAVARAAAGGVGLTAFVSACWLARELATQG